MLKRLHYLVLAVILAAGAGCDSTTDPFDGQTDESLLVAAPTWRLVRLANTAGREVDVSGEFTLQLSSGGQASGRAGPNHFAGKYHATSFGDLHFDSLVTTLIGGADAESGAHYLAQLAEARRYRATPEELRVFGPEGDYMHFRRK